MRQTNASAGRYLGDEFNAFLFAMVGTDRSGGTLSVISALARLDLDAWAEAAALARLPRDIAANKLSVRLQKFTEIPQISQNAGSIAVRLIALLPQTGPAPARLLGNAGAWAMPGGIGLVILLSATLLFGIQLLAARAPAAAPPPATTPVAAGGR